MIKQKGIISKIIDVVKNPLYFLYWLDCKKIITINDEKFLKIKFERRMNKKLNLKNPQTFNEKLQWLKLYDRNPEYTKMVDKYEVKKYVSDIIGEEYIIPTLGVWDSFNYIDFSKLPNQFVLKCTHDSGSIIICKNKEEFDYKEAKQKLEKILRINYYYLSREWPYKNIKPRIIAEKYMVDPKSDELLDYKMMCFNGKVKCSFVCSERYSDNGLKVTFFDLNWNKLPFERYYPSSDKYIQQPKNYDVMIKLSEQLAKNIPFVRVDWYEVEGKLYFGELTFFPGAGHEKFTPSEWDKKLGDMLELPKNKLEEKNEK